MIYTQSPAIPLNMVAAAVRMRTPSAMFLSRGAASMRRPQVSYKFQEVMQYVPLVYMDAMK